MLDRDTVALAILQALITNEGMYEIIPDNQVERSFKMADRFQVIADRAQFRDPPMNDTGMAGGVQMAPTPIHPSEEVVGNKITPADGRLYRRDSTGDVFYVPMGCWPLMSP